MGDADRAFGRPFKLAILQKGQHCFFVLYVNSKQPGARAQTSWCPVLWVVDVIDRVTSGGRDRESVLSQKYNGKHMAVPGVSLVPQSRSTKTEERRSYRFGVLR